MERRDYLKKEIDLIGAVLGLILSKLSDLKSKGPVEDNQERMARQSLEEQLQIDLTALLQMPETEMVPFLKTQRNFSNKNLAVFSEILWKLIEEKTAVPNLMPSCLNLLLYLEQTEKDYDLQRHWKIMQLKSIRPDEKDT